MLLLPDIDIRRKAFDLTEKLVFPEDPEGGLAYALDVQKQLETLLLDALAEERERCVLIVRRRVRSAKLRAELLAEIKSPTY